MLICIVQAALMIFVLDTAIGIGIWVPFTIGKTTALLTVRYFVLSNPLPLYSLNHYVHSWTQNDYYKFCIYQYEPCDTSQILSSTW